MIRKNPRLSVQSCNPSVFVGCMFEVRLQCLDEKSQPKLGDSFPLAVKIYTDEKSPRELDASRMLEVDEASLSIDDTALATVSLCIKETSRSHNQVRFILHFSSIGPQSISPTQTEPIFVVLYKLEASPLEGCIIQEGDMADGIGYGKPDEPSLIWYKDEGGREKVIDLTAKLKDCHGSLIRGHVVPVKCSLLYGDRRLVPRQDLLRLSTENRLVLDETGEVKIKFRIDDVSKNHQNQSFRLLVVPDPSQSSSLSFIDISGATSSPVKVLSKRNNKAKKAAKDNLRKPIVATRPGLSTLDQSLLAQYYPFMHLAQLPPPVRMMQPMPSINYTNTSASMSCTMPVVDCKSYCALLDEIISREQRTHELLTFMTWTPIGYEKRNDDSVDQDKPLFSMANPNSLIVQIQSGNAQALMNLSRIQSALKNYDQICCEKIDRNMYTVDDVCDDDDDEDDDEDDDDEDRGKKKLAKEGKLDEPNKRQRLDVSDQYSNVQQLSSDRSNTSSASLQQQMHSFFGTSFLTGQGGLSSSDDPIMAPSMMLRQESDILFCASPMMADNDMTLPPLTNGVQERNQLEIDVEYILASLVTHSGRSIGNPAFNRDKSLIGFYLQEGSDISFHPATAVMSIFDISKTDIEGYMQTCLLEKKNVVCWMVNFNNDLNALKRHAVRVTLTSFLA